MTEKEIRHKIEYAFYNYKFLKETAQDYVLVYAERNLGIDYSRVRGSGGDIDGGLCKAIDKSRETYLWCRVVELTRERFRADEDASIIIKDYFKGNREHRRHRMQAICTDLYISDTVFYDALKKILNYAINLAVQCGLIIICNDF